MALADMNVKIGADLSELLSKIDAAKAKLNQLVESQGQLKVSINDLNSSLKQNEAELSKTATSLKRLVDGGKGATAEAQKLRKEISGLAANSAQLTTSLSNAKTQLAATTAQIKTQTIAVKEAETASGGFAKGATKAFSALRTLANIIPGIGIGGLVALIAGPVVDAFKEWWDAIDNVNTATKILKAQQSDLSDIVKDANKEAGSQIADLNLLYTAATNVNLSMRDRLSAAKALNAEFPETFQNFTAEEIALGKAKSAYDATTQAILAQSRAKAVKNKLDVIEIAQLDNDAKKQQLLIDAGKKLIEIQKQGDKLQDVGMGVFVKVTAEQQAAAVNASLKLALNQIDIDNKILDERRRFAASFLDIKTIAPDTGRLKEIDDQIKFLQAQKELHASTLADVKDFNAKIAALQAERDLIDPPKIKKAAKEHAKIYTETLQHALAELFAKGFQGPEDPFADLIKGSKGKISVDLSGIKENLAAIAALDAATAIALGKLKEFQAQVDNIIQNMASSIVDGLSGAFETAFSGGSFGKSLFTSIFSALGSAMQQLGKVAIETGLGIKAIKTALETLQPIVAIAAGVSLLALGALIKSQASKIGAFAEGGEVKGPGGPKSDSILARLSPGEYVLKSEAVKRITVPVLNKLNQGGAPSFINGIARFANGGFVSPSLLGSIIGGQAIQVEITGRLKGNDIYVSNQRAAITRGRNS